MYVTEHFYNDIRQRLVHCKEELNKVSNYEYRIAVSDWNEDAAYFEGRICELEFMLEQLDHIRASEIKFNLQQITEA